MIVRVLSLGSRNLLVLLCLAAITTLALDAHGRESGAQAYGSNPAAGGYVHTADAKIYYERYGFGGRPLVLLHGGVYGYIDEFANLISRLAPTRTVIAIASRGYGPSELGTQPFRTVFSPATQPL